MARDHLFAGRAPAANANLSQYINAEDWSYFQREAKSPANGNSAELTWHWSNGQGERREFSVQLAPLPPRPNATGNWLLASLWPLHPEQGPGDRMVNQNTFTQVFSLSPVAMALTSQIDWRIQEVNRALCQMVGLPREDILGRTPQELHLLDNTSQREHVKEAIDKHGVLHNEEIQFLDAQGNLHHALLSAGALNLGNEPCIFAVIMDVSEHHHGSRLIQIQRDLALELASASRPDEVVDLCLETAMAITDMDCGAIYLADPDTGDFVLARHSGLSDALLAEVERRPADILAMDPITGDEPYYWVDGQPRHSGMPNIDLGGLKSLALFPIRYEGVAVACLCVLSRRPKSIPRQAAIALETLAAHLGSVIGRSLAEQALRISEEHLRSLLLNAKDFAVYRLKSDASKPFGLKVLFASPSLKELLGVDNVEDLWEWARNVLPEDLPQIIEANQQAFKTHRFEAKGRVRLPGEQKVRWFRAMASGVLDQDGTHYINGMIIDVSRNEEAQRALNAYQARLRALALQLSRAEENQRRALAMDLHDGVGQLLAAAKLRLQDVVVFRAGSELARELSEVLNLIEKMIALTRSVTAELSPPVLHDLGLEAALEWLGDRTESEYGLPVDMHFQDRPISLDEDMRVILFRSVRELLHNVVKHASANRAVIALKLRGDRIVVQVSDDGVGFSHPENAERGGPDQRFGLFSIRDRLEYLGGAMQVDSQPGQGAIVTLIAPTRLRT